MSEIFGRLYFPAGRILGVGRDKSCERIDQSGAIR